MISPLAYIDPEAQIGQNVEIAPFVYIDRNVVIGDNNKIMAGAPSSMALALAMATPSSLVR